MVFLLIRKIFLVFGMLFLLQNVSGQQKLLNQVGNRIVYEKLDSITKQARVKSFDIKPRKKRLYYWYWKNSFQKNYGGFEGSLLHGDYIVFDKQENLLEKAIFKKGIIRGKYLYWNKEGTLIRAERWKCGVKSGVYKVYNDYGDLIEKGRFKRAKKHGLSRFFVNGKKYKILKYKKDKVLKDLMANKRERENIRMQKKNEKRATKQQSTKKTKTKDKKKKPEIKKSEKTNAQKKVKQKPKKIKK